MTQSFSRGKLSEATGVNSETIRYYESKGLMPEPKRTSGGHRVYSDSHRKRLQFIHRCRELGFNLADIAKLLSLANESEDTCEEIQTVTNAHLNKIRQKILDLKKMQKTLIALDAECKTSNPDCAFIEALFDK